MVKYRQMTGFGKRLAIARENAGYKSQAAFARKLGLDSRVYQPWESGKDGKQVEPNYSTLVMLAKALNVSLLWLLAGIEEETSKAHSQREVELLQAYRKAEQMGVAGKIEDMIKYIFYEADKENLKTYKKIGEENLSIAAEQRVKYRKKVKKS